MGWAKFDDQFTDHPKVQAAGPMAELLAMRAVIYCARYETDGHVRESVLPRLTVGIPSVKRQISALIREGLWEKTDDGWLVHDFLDYHPSRSEKDAERQAARERMRNVRANKTRTSDEVQEQFGKRSRYPDPTRPHTSPNGDGLFESLFEFVYGRPYRPGESLPKSERGRLNAGVKEAKDAGIGAEEIRERGRRYASEWRGLTRSPQGLLANWTRFAPNPVVPDCGTCGARGVVWFNPAGERVAWDAENATDAVKCSECAA